MAKTLYDSKGEEIKFVETVDIQNLKILKYHVYDEFGITDPIEGFKKIYQRIPMNEGYPIFIYMNCGAMYTVIAQKSSNNYLSCIIFGYQSHKLIYLRKLQEIWYES